MNPNPVSPQSLGGTLQTINLRVVQLFAESTDLLITVWYILPVWIGMKSDGRRKHKDY